MSLIIDVGHEGVGVGLDPGAVGNGIHEANMVLDISLYQYTRFKELGVPVQITRTKAQKLNQVTRTAMVKNSGMKHCISNHINAGGGDGAEIIYSIHSKPTFAQVVLDELHKVGQNKRKIFTRKLNNESKHDYYYMHRQTGAVETIIVEYGFLDSKKDDIIQLKRDWKLYAEAVVKAYCQYAGYKYTPKKEEVKEVKVESIKEFKDVLITNIHKEAIIEVKNLGIMVGDGTGNFLPDKAITRAEMASVISRLYNKLKG